MRPGDLGLGLGKGKGIGKPVGQSGSDEALQASDQPAHLCRRATVGRTSLFPPSPHSASAVLGCPKVGTVHGGVRQKNKARLQLVVLLISRNNSPSSTFEPRA